MNNREAVATTFASDLLDAAECGFILLDRQGRVALWNKWMERVSSIEMDCARGTEFNALFSTPLPSRLSKAVELALSRGIASRLSHKLNRDLLPLSAPGPPSGEGRRIAQTIIVRAFGPVEERNCLVQVFDVSAADASETILKEARAKAEAASQSKGAFLAQMSHEFRTPLNAIMGFSDVMSHGLFGPLGDARYAEYTKYIHESGKHLLRLVNDILDVSKIEAGALAIEEEEVDLAGIIDDALGLVGPKAERTGVVMNYQLPSEMPSVFVDRRRIKQVLINILANAIEFSSPGGTIELSAHLSPESLRVVIKDQGIGMSAADVAIALESFGQVGDVVTRNKEGSGLGLPLSVGLMALHGGRLDIESREGIGTSVILDFPAARLRQPRRVA
jgi:signal transduction histidine kinase